MSLHNETTRTARVRKIDQDLSLTGRRMRDLAGVVNLAWGDGMFRARTHVVAGVLSLRFYWRDGVEDTYPAASSRSSFELESEAGIQLLESLEPKSCVRLISLARKAGLLNHQYRVLFHERRSLRRFGKADTKLLEIQQKLKSETERGNQS